MTSVMHDAASVGALGDRWQIGIFVPCRQDKDGATAGLAPEPVDTHSMFRWCTIVNDALYGHESLSFPSAWRSATVDSGPES
jgi:hypothetical protein